jgi:hypothetical protein
MATASHTPPSASSGVHGVRAALDLIGRVADDLGRTRPLRWGGDVARTVDLEARHRKLKSVANMFHESLLLPRAVVGGSERQQDVVGPETPERRPRTR